MLDVAILATVLRSSNGKDTRFKTSTRVSLEGDLKNLLLSPEHANLFLHALALSIVSESGIFVVVGWLGMLAFHFCSAEKGQHSYLFAKWQRLWRE
jgi:hypothetical protein